MMSCLLLHTPKKLSDMTFANFPQDAGFPLIIFGHEFSFSAIETEFRHSEMIRKINYVSCKCYQEMIIVLHLILHEWTMLETGIE